MRMKREREIDQDKRSKYVSMAVDEDYEDDTATFAYNGLRVPIVIRFDQIGRFDSCPREGVNLLPVTLTNNTHPKTHGLKHT